jgi:hypothetical protein
MSQYFKKYRKKRPHQLPPVCGNTREELMQAPLVFPRITPGFEMSLTLTTESGTPVGYLDLANAELIANWLAEKKSRS